MQNSRSPAHRQGLLQKWAIYLWRYLQVFRYQMAGSKVLSVSKVLKGCLLSLRIGQVSRQQALIVVLCISCLQAQAQPIQCQPQLQAKLTFVESQLLKHPESPVLQALYRHLTQACRQPQTSSHRWYNQVGLTLGKSSNPLQASETKTITLTLPQTNLILPNASQPKAQTYHQLQFGSQLLTQEFQASLQVRLTQWHTATLKDENQWALRLQPSTYQVNLYPVFHLYHLQTQAQTLSTFGLQLRHDFTSQWQTRFGLFAQRYQQTLYNQNLLQWQLIYHPRPHQFTISLQQAQPTEGRDSRAGGGQNRLGVTWQHRWRTTIPWQLVSTFQYQYAQDTEGYSPYLSHNQIRTLSYTSLALTLGRALSHKSTVHLTAQYRQQSSNLPLFSWRQRQVELTFLKSF